MGIQAKLLSSVKPFFLILDEEHSCTLEHEQDGNGTHINQNLFTCMQCHAASRKHRGKRWRLRWSHWRIQAQSEVALKCSAHLGFSAKSIYTSFWNRKGKHEHFSRSTEHGNAFAAEAKKAQHKSSSLRQCWLPSFYSGVSHS